MNLPKFLAETFYRNNEDYIYAKTLDSIFQTIVNPHNKGNHWVLRAVIGIHNPHDSADVLIETLIQDDLINKSEFQPVEYTPTKKGLKNVEGDYYVRQFIKDKKLYVWEKAIWIGGVTVAVSTLAVNCLFLWDYFQCCRM